MHFLFPYLFRSHPEFMAALSGLVDPQIEYPLLNDPDFQDPGSSGRGTGSGA